MNFEENKRITLAKQDKSKKGKIDNEIKPLVNIINSFPCMYTTSSCAGRISLLQLSKNHRKDESEWSYITHDFSDNNKVWQALEGSVGKETWFRMESAIVHVCCKDIDTATWLLELAHKAGFKHSGIISIKPNRIMVEVFGSERIDTIVCDNEILISALYLKHLVEYANKKLQETRKRIKKFEELLSKSPHN